MVALRGLFRTEVMGKNIGKLVPASKKMIKWGLIINLKKVEITLKHSTVTGKRLIRVNEVVVHESRGFMARSFSTSFTVDDYFVEVSFLKENGDIIYDMFVDGIPYMELLCLYDLSEEDRLCIEKGKIPSKKTKKAKKTVKATPKGEEVEEEVEEEVDYDAPVERRMHIRNRKNFLSSQEFGNMDEADMRKSGMFDGLPERMAAMKLNMDVQDADVDVSDVDADWEEPSTRHHLKDLSKKVVVPEKQRNVKVIKPKYKKHGDEVYGQL